MRLFHLPIETHAYPAIMDQEALKKRLLFVHADVHKPVNQQRARSKRLDKEIRRHLMVDIGRARRKPPRAPQYDTHVWSLSRTSASPNYADPTDMWATLGSKRPQDPSNDNIAAEEGSQITAPFIATSPWLHALSVFEREWGEDSFSAYGFTLIMVAGNNATKACKLAGLFEYH